MKVLVGKIEDATREWGRKSITGAQTKDWQILKLTATIFSNESRINNASEKRADRSIRQTKSWRRNRGEMKRRRGRERVNLEEKNPLVYQT